MKRLHLLFISIFFFISCSERQSTVQKKENNIYYDKAFEYKESMKSDSAFLFFNKAKELFLQQKDSLGAGKCLLNMAIISTEKGDYYGGQEISLSAIAYFDKTKKKHQIYIQSNFNNLGLASEHLEQYPEALAFYKQSLIYTTDNSASLIVNNNIANVYRRLKDYKSALTIYDRILRQSINTRELARVLSNQAFTKWLEYPSYNAGPDLLKALNIREKEHDLWGQNASYAHFSAYYAKNHPDSALFYALKMYEVATDIKSADDQLQALQKLIRFSSTKAAKHYFESYRKLDDSVENSRYAAKNQFALIRYETEKNKADNLKLQKDNTDIKYQVIKREILLYSSLLVFVVGTFIAIIWYRKRRQRLELEAKNAIRENQLQTSKKVHDVVANGLYRVMTEIENQDQIDKGHILDKIEDLYEKSRDISYEKREFTGENFQETIAELIKSFATENTKVILVGNSPDLWTKVGTKVKFEIEHILQELMVNMKKHSHANNVVFRFEQEDDQLSIYYVDNGIGMPEGLQPKNGLTNTGNRIDSINGTIIFDTNVEKGLRIQLSFPLS